MTTMKPQCEYPEAAQPNSKYVDNDIDDIDNINDTSLMVNSISERISLGCPIQLQRPPPNAFTS